MKKLALLILTSLFVVAWGASDKEAPRGAWLQDGLKWTQAPPDINPHLRSAQAAILFFGEDHKFAIIYCTVGRETKKYMTISNGDPRGVYRGEWTANQSSISVTYRLEEATILQKGQTLPGPMQRATVKISQGSVMTFEAKTFRRAVALDKSASEAVYGVRQSSRNLGGQKDKPSVKSEEATPTTR